MLKISEEEEVIKRNEEFEAKYPSKSFIDSLPLISNIKAYSDRVFKIDVDAASKELTVQVNEEFITEAIKIATKLTINLIEPALNLAAVFENYADEVCDLKDKWNPEETEEEITSNDISADKVPAEIRSKVSQTEWTPALDKSPYDPKPFFTDEDKENYIFVQDLVWSRGDEKFHLTPNDTAYMLGNVERTVTELASYNNIPASLVRAVYAHYKVEFTPKQLGQEEVKPVEETPLTAQETIEKAFNESQSNNK